MTALTDRILELLPDARLHREVDDDHELMIYGPPGTGKTRSLGVILDAHLKAGLAADQMLVNAFTRNATWELKHRLQTQYGLTETEMPWVRTIHSSCFRLLGLRPEQVVTHHALKVFGEASGYLFQGVLTQRNIDDPYAAGSIQTFGDWCYIAEELRRARQQTITEAVDLLRSKNPTDQAWNETEAKEFSESYASWKRDAGLLDFTDMLELVLRERCRPPIRWMWLDEAQDMSPLQWRVAELWAQAAERLFVMADDDQAIFSFAGADPHELWRRPGHQLVLSHSYRLPRAVHAEAQRIIRRASERVPKDFEPHTDGGTVDRVWDWMHVAREREGTWLLLIRNRAFGDDVRGVLMSEAVPFFDRTSYDGVPDPASPRGRAVAVALALHQGQVVRGNRLRSLQLQVRDDMWPPGANAQWGRGYSLVDLGTLGATPELVRMLAEAPLLALRMERGQRHYLTALLDKGPANLLERPRIELSTIHGVKGEEADHVAISTAMTRRTHTEYGSEPDPEHRTFYVGATRARRSLTWVQGGQGYRL